MSERTDISFDAALMMALRADAQHFVQMRKENWIRFQRQSSLRKSTQIRPNGTNE